MSCVQDVRSIYVERACRRTKTRAAARDDSLRLVSSSRPRQRWSIVGLRWYYVGTIKILPFRSPAEAAMIASLIFSTG